MAQDTQQVIEIPPDSHCAHSLTSLNLPPSMVFTVDSKKHNITRTTALIMEK